MKSFRTGRCLICAAILAAACSKVPDGGSGQRIVFQSGIQTKAMLDSEDINVAGTELTIYGFNGTGFIPGETASYSVAYGWTLENEYFWESGKDYSFFAWLNKDKDGNEVSGIDASTITTDRKLAVSERTFDFASTDNDFDFCYSDVVCRPGAEADHSEVELSLQHLYSAIAFSACNYTGSAITIKDVTLFGLKNSKSAVVEFADGGVSVSYDNQACTWTSGRKLNGSDIALASGESYANVVGTPSSTREYHMFWPQTPGELAAEDWTDSATAPSGGAYVRVVYNDGSADVTRYARLPQDNDGTADLGWPAGTKRIMELSFSDSIFTLNLSVLPWDYTESEVRYDDEVTVASPLQFDENTCTVDAENRRVYFLGALPITGSFHITSPDASTWVISKEGDFDAFEIDDAVAGKGGYGDKEDRNYGPVDITEGNSFTLYPMPVAEGRDYSITLSFSIRYPNGESYCIDEKVQPEGKWTIILTK